MIEYTSVEPDIKQNHTSRRKKVDRVDTNVVEPELFEPELVEPELVDNWFGVVLDSVEIIGQLLTMTFLGFWYMPIGALAQRRASDGHDWTEQVMIDLDLRIEVLPIMIIPYVVMYLLPVLYAGLAINQLGLRRSLPLIRRFYALQYLLMLVSYVLFIMFPVTIYPIMYDQPDPNSSFLERYTWTFVKAGMSDYCTWPSMHVGHTVGIYLIHYRDRLPYSGFSLMMMCVTWFSTVLTRAHYILDVPAGIVVGIVVERLMFGVSGRTIASSAIERFGNWFDRNPIKRLLISIAVPLITLLGNELLSHMTGVRTDMIGMLLGTVSRNGFPDRTTSCENPIG